MIIAVDFDGTVCEDRFPEIGKAYPEVINMLLRMQEDGHQLILWTCRRDERLAEAVEWCRGWGLEFDAVNSNLKENIERYGGDTRKVSADLYLDDKNIGIHELIRMSEAKKGRQNNG